LRHDSINTLLPSGVQPTAVSTPGWKVNRMATPPLAGMMYTSVLPSTVAV
jgi:hypothetical protein